MNRREATGLSLIIIAGALWGTIGVVSRWLHDDGLTPLTISTLRFCIASCILVVWSLSLYGRAVFALPRRDVLLMLVNGIALAISQTAYLTAVTLAGVTISTLVVICAAPIMVAAYATFVQRERLDGRITFALVTSVIGTALLVGVPDGAGATDLPTGLVYSLISAVTYATFVQLGHSLTRRYEPLHINAVSFGIGTLVLLAVAQPTGMTLPDAPHEWLLVAFLGVFPSVTAYALFLRGMRVTSATVSGILVLVEPLVAALLAALIFGERLSPLALIGGALMCAGFLALVRKRSSATLVDGEQPETKPSSAQHL